MTNHYRIINNDARAYPKIFKYGKSIKLAYIACNTPTTIAIVGAGFSGSLVATNLLNGTYPLRGLFWGLYSLFSLGFSDLTADKP
ncbi:hypothetical protein [Microcoleus sp. Pol17_C1]|uniref:hypothetical protein n=1 Tax=unclassified Microcoleus TaxID=2642155 RepID=UPI002FCF6286